MRLTVAVWPDEACQATPHRLTCSRIRGCIINWSIAEVRLINPSCCYVRHQAPAVCTLYLGSMM